MPLVWAHAEYLKLVRSLRDGRVFDLPPRTWQRYVIDRVASHIVCWRFNRQPRTIAGGQTLRLETLVPCLVHWSVDGWRTTTDAGSGDSGIGEHVVDLPTAELPSGTRIDFTFYWLSAGRWEQVDFYVTVTGPPRPQGPTAR